MEVGGQKMSSIFRLNNAAVISRTRFFSWLQTRAVLRLQSHLPERISDVATDSIEIPACRHCDQLGRNYQQLLRTNPTVRLGDDNFHPTKRFFHKASEATLDFTASKRTLCAPARPAGFPGILDVLREKIWKLGEEKVKQLKQLRQKHGDKAVCECTVNATTGGLRGLTCLLTETSQLHPQRGIMFRGYTIDELVKQLPKLKQSEHGMVEGLIWLLLTGEFPTVEEAQNLSRELVRRSVIPEHTWQSLDALPVDSHPMTQLCVGTLALQSLSTFAFAYTQRVPKTEYWRFMLEDALSLLAKLPRIAAFIYQRSFKDGQRIEPLEHLDWAANFAHMMGYDSDEHYDLMRLYMTIHADHEGGNVSAHAAHLVGSALSDPYLSYTAGMTGLAGPLHGLANQECLTWLVELKRKLGDQGPTQQNIAAIARSTLESGSVIPGYGHAVLRTTDPRFLLQRSFALKNLPNSELFRLLEVCYQTIPQILKQTGKIANPYPNVDCHSGVLLQHYGITEAKFYTVLFGVSRAIGIVSQLVWARLLGLPLERPKSTTINELLATFGQ